MTGARDQAEAHMRPQWDALVEELRRRLGADWPADGELGAAVSAGEPTISHGGNVYFWGSPGEPWGYTVRGEHLEVWTVGDHGSKVEKRSAPLGNPRAN
jgi:hypothetical protein